MERKNRTWLCSVLFMDIVDYSKLPDDQQMLVKQSFSTLVVDALKFANAGFKADITADPALAQGVNTYRGHITYAAVAAAFEMSYTTLDGLT